MRLRTWNGGRHELSLALDSKVAELRLRAAGLLNAPQTRVQLLWKGRVLNDLSPLAELQGRDEVLAIVTPLQPQSLRGHQQYSSDADLDLPELTKFELPANASLLQRQLAALLQNRLHCPELLLVILFAVPLRIWVSASVWLLCAPLAAKLDLGPLYVLATICAVIFLNLGTRKEGDASAYTIFNNFRALPGQLTANEIDGQVRRGQM